MNAVTEKGDDMEVVAEKILDASTPGAQILFDPDEAAKAGAFDDDAISERDALDAAIDVDVDGYKPHQGGDRG